MDGKHGTGKLKASSTVVDMEVSAKGILGWENEDACFLGTHVYSLSAIATVTPQWLNESVKQIFVYCNREDLRG